MSPSVPLPRSALADRDAEPGAAVREIQLEQADGADRPVVLEEAGDEEVAALALVGEHPLEPLLLGRLRHRGADRQRVRVVRQSLNHPTNRGMSVRSPARR